MAPETVASGSPDAMHARAEHGGNVNQIRVTMPMSVWGVIALAVAAFILSGISLYEVSQVRMHEQLNAYNLRELSVNQITYLESHVRTDDALIQAYGIGKECGRAK
jgi:hypothetical protein